jgi:hypothetical protein
MATKDLIRRLENAPDFGYDDEEVELSKRYEWRWDQSSYKPKVILGKKKDRIVDKDYIVADAMNKEAFEDEIRRRAKGWTLVRVDTLTKATAERPGAYSALLERERK